MLLLTSRLRRQRSIQFPRSSHGVLSSISLASLRVIRLVLQCTIVTSMTSSLRAVSVVQARTGQARRPSCLGRSEEKLKRRNVWQLLGNCCSALLYRAVDRAATARRALPCRTVRSTCSVLRTAVNCPIWPSSASDHECQSSPRAPFPRRYSPPGRLICWRLTKLSESGNPVPWLSKTSCQVTDS